MTIKEILKSGTSATSSFVNSLTNQMCGYFNVLSAKEIFKDQSTKIEWLVEDLFMRGGTSIIVAREKTGKSTFARQVGLAIAEGKNILGKKTEKGLVFYLAFEDHVGGIKEHLAKMGGSEIDNLLFHCGNIKGNIVDALETFCKVKHPDMIIIDTLAKALKVDDLNAYATVIKALQPITDIARKYNVHITYLHHMNKFSYGDDISKAMGSVGITGEVDNIILLSKDTLTDMRILKTIPRYGKQLDSTLLAWNKDKDLYQIEKKQEEDNDEDVF